MKFTYVPEGKKYDIQADQLEDHEAEAIEEAGGSQWDTFAGWADKLNRGGFRAWRVAAWIMLLRTNPDLAFEEFRPKVADIQIDMGDDDEEGKDESGPEVSETGDEPTSSDAPSEATEA